MSESYAKLFSTIATSTIWGESLATRVVWVTMLASADRRGIVLASIPGLARLANVSLEECEHALERLSAPDPYSRTKEHEGRRIEEVDGGWTLLNHRKYREKLAAEDRREQQAAWVKEKRSKGRDRTDDDRQPSTHVDMSTESTHADADTDASSVTTIPASPQNASAAPTAAGLACRLMREAGCRASNPSNPNLLAALAEGVTPEALAHTVREGIENQIRKPFEWAIATARGRHLDGARLPAGTTHPRAGPSAPLSKTGAAAAALDQFAEVLEARSDATHPPRLVHGADRPRLAAVADSEP